MQSSDEEVDVDQQVEQVEELDPARKQLVMDAAEVFSALPYCVQALTNGKGSRVFLSVGDGATALARCMSASSPDSANPAVLNAHVRPLLDAFVESCRALNMCRVQVSRPCWTSAFNFDNLLTACRADGGSNAMSWREPRNCYANYNGDGSDFIGLFGSKSFGMTNMESITDSTSTNGSHGSRSSAMPAGDIVTDIEHSMLSFSPSKKRMGVACADLLRANLRRASEAFLSDEENEKLSLVKHAKFLARKRASLAEAANDAINANGEVADNTDENGGESFPLPDSFFEGMFPSEGAMLDRTSLDCASPTASSTTAAAGGHAVARSMPDSMFSIYEMY